jgi:group I intron endonuclease
MVIYKTINLQTGKIYIGKDKHNNPKYLGSGVKLKDAIESYGRDNFLKIILEQCSSYEDLNVKESYWIQFYNSTNPEIGYNISTGGDGGDNFTNHPNKEEYRNKLSKAAIKSNERIKNKLKDISTQLWKNDTYKNNVLGGLNKYWKNEYNKENFSKKMKEILKDPEKRKIWSDCKKGDKNKRWLGFAYLYNIDGTLIKKYDKISTALVELKINYGDMNKIRSGERDIILTSSSHLKSKFEGYRILITKI